MKRILPFILTGICLVWLAGCSESDCPLNNNPMNSISFMNSATGKALTLTDTLTVTALGTDSILINRMRGTSKLSLPLRYEGGETSYVFKYTKVKYDTLQLKPLKIDTIITVFKDTIGMTYTDRKHFLSMDCGIVTYFNLESIRTTRHLIDSVRLLNPAIDEYEKTNIEVYLPAGN